MIPKKIYQSWKTKNLDPKTQEMVKRTLDLNPGYTHELYDDKDCREFLLKHFGINYANAFDVLRHGAFKCDFWRYAKLYVDGGIYMDLDMMPLVPFSEIIKENDEFVSAVDRKMFNVNGIYQAFVACAPRHPILLCSLQIAFSNIVTRRGSLYETYSITGPGVMAVAFNLCRNLTDTNTDIVKGVYKGINGNIRLHTMNGDYTHDINGKRIFKNRFDGYKSGGNYISLIEDYYKDDPRLRLKKIRFWMNILIVFVLIVMIVLFVVYWKKWKTCKSSCVQEG